MVSGLKSPLVRVLRQNLKLFTVSYFDIGANLCSPSFKDDLEAVLVRAQNAGVGEVLVTASDLDETMAAIALSQKYPDLLAATAGVHPHQAVKVTANYIDQLKTFSGYREVKAMGEMGLDFNRNYSPRADQEAVFASQLELAAQTGKPVFLHERDAGRRFREIFTPWRDQLFGGVLHCFTGTQEDLRAYLDLDLYIGITGWICDPKRGQSLRELVRLIPDKRLLIETDAPYLSPKTLTSAPKRNEPCYLPEVARIVAECRGQEQAHIAALTLLNARTLFGD